MQRQKDSDKTMMPDEVLLEHLAEKCTELVHAIFTLKRVKEGRAKLSGAEEALTDALADVQMMLSTYLMKQTPDYVGRVERKMHEKERRWIEKLNRH